MSAARKILAKERWEKCEKIAKQFNEFFGDVTGFYMQKTEVHQFLWAELSDQIKTDIYNGSKEAVESILNLPGYKRLVDERLNTNTNRVKAFDETRVKDKTPAEQIKLAMWFIDKVAEGDFEMALKVLKAAGAAMKELERTSK